MTQPSSDNLVVGINGQAFSLGEGFATDRLALANFDECSGVALVRARALPNQVVLASHRCVVRSFGGEFTVATLAKENTPPSLVSTAFLYYAKSDPFGPLGLQRIAVVAAGGELWLRTITGNFAKLASEMLGEPRSGSLGQRIWSAGYVSLACAWSPDGTQIVSGSDDGHLKIWQPESGVLCVKMKGKSGSIAACAWSPDGTRLVSGAKDGILDIWDADSGDALTRLRGHSGWICACDWSPDGKHILSASSDATLRVWDVEAGTARVTMLGHTGRVAACAWAPDGAWIVSGALDKTVKVWDAQSGAEINTFVAAGDFHTPALGRAGQAIAAGGPGGLYILEPIPAKASVPLATLVYLYRFHRHRFDEQPSVKCELCGERFSPADTVINAIHEIKGQAKLPNVRPSRPRFAWLLRRGSAASAFVTGPNAGLPPAAWDDARLLSECPRCLQPIRFNPFIVDNRDRY